MVLIEQLDFTATNCHIDHAHPDLFGKVGYQFPAKIIGGGKPGFTAAQRRNGGIPSSFCPTQVGAIQCFHHLKTGVHIYGILRFNFGVPFHVGLPKTEVNMEVFVLRICVHI